MGTQALPFLRFSKRTERSTARSRTTGNFERGARVMGWSLFGPVSLSTRAEQAIVALPLVSMAQGPQISSRQVEAEVIGVVGLPVAATGWSAVSPMSV